MRLTSGCPTIRRARRDDDQILDAVVAEQVQNFAQARRTGNLTRLSRLKRAFCRSTDGKTVDIILGGISQCSLRADAAMLH
jgi:hypothetical protein